MKSIGTQSHRKNYISVDLGKQKHFAIYKDERGFNEDHEVSFTKTKNGFKENNLPDIKSLISKHPFNFYEV